MVYRSCDFCTFAQYKVGLKKIRFTLHKGKPFSKMVIEKNATVVFLNECYEQKVMYALLKMSPNMSI